MHNLWSIYGPSYFWRSKQPNWFFGPIRPNKANWKLLDLIVLLCAQFTFVVFPDAVYAMPVPAMACNKSPRGGVCTGHHELAIVKCDGLRLQDVLTGQSFELRSSHNLSLAASKEAQRRALSQQKKRLIFISVIYLRKHGGVCCTCISAAYKYNEREPYLSQQKKRLRCTGLSTADYKVLVLYSSTILLIQFGNRVAQVGHNIRSRI
jgi:hypothetical protein